MTQEFELRSLGHDDALRLADIHIAAFGNKHHTQAQIQAHYRKIFAFLANAPQEVTQYLSVGAVRNDEVFAFVIGAPIAMQFMGEPLTACSATLLAMHPDHRNPLIVRELLQQLFAAPVAYTTADRVNDLGRRAAVGADMTFYPGYSLRWGRVLSPGAALQGATRNRRSFDGGPADALLRLGSTAIDRTVGRAMSQRLALPKVRKPYERTEMLASDVVEHAEELLANYPVRPDYRTEELASQRWDAMAMLRGDGQHHRCGIWTTSGKLLGWYYLHIWPSGTGEVLQLVAAPGSADALVAALFEHAAELGVGSLHGNSQPSVQVALGDAGAVFHNRNASYGVHTVNPKIADAFGRSEALVTGLEGEYPLMLGSS